jgi:hypothetical protein
MKNVDDTFEFDGINGPERVTVEVGYDLQNASTLESL